MAILGGCSNEQAGFVNDAVCFTLDLAAAADYSCRLDRWNTLCHKRNHHGGKQWDCGCSTYCGFRGKRYSCS